MTGPSSSTTATRVPTLAAIASVKTAESVYLTKALFNEPKGHRRPRALWLAFVNRGLQDPIAGRPNLRALRTPA